MNVMQDSGTGQLLAACTLHPCILIHTLLCAVKGQKEAAAVFFCLDCFLILPQIGCCPVCCRNAAVMLSQAAGACEGSR